MPILLFQEQINELQNIFSKTGIPYETGEKAVLLMGKKDFTRLYTSGIMFVCSISKCGWYFI